MRSITYKDFFKSKELLGVIIKDEAQLKEMQKKSLQHTGRNKFHDFGNFFDVSEYRNGIVLVNNGTWIEEGVCDRIKTYLYDEIVEYTDEEYERLMRCIWGIGYSFRFNESRRTTTLYKTDIKWVQTPKGPKVQVKKIDKLRVVKCHEEDVFDWKVGLALCFARSIFAKDDDVQYLKSKLSAKKFAEYVLMKVYKFNEDDYDQLKLRVKDAGVCDEIHI